MFKKWHVIFSKGTYNNVQIKNEIDMFIIFKDDYFQLKALENGCYNVNDKLIFVKIKMTVSEILVELFINPL